MNAALFIRTYDGDLEWLKLCLRSVRVNARGFAQVVVVGDDTGARALSMASDYGVDTAYDERSGVIENGYVAQQASKMRADEFLEDWIDHVCFIDSDCLVTEPFSPEVCFRDGKPEYLVTPWCDVPDAEKAWREITQNAVGVELDFEFMRRHGGMYLVDDIRDARKWLEEREGMGLIELLGRVISFSEFNFLGAWCYLHRPGNYYWVDTSTASWRQLPVRQFWSHGSKELGEAKAWAEENL